MNPRHHLTQMATTRLIQFLEKVGNKLNVNHKMALTSLTDAMTRMSEGEITGRLAYGLPTGTGKTSAIIEWAASVHALKLPYSVAVASSRIDALITMKAHMMKAGIPEQLIGLLHESKTDKHRKAPGNTDSENQDRPILLMSHQMIRASESNLKRYNSYKSRPRNLLVYDESLLTSDVRHFTVRSLCAAIAHAIETYKRQDEHSTVLNFLTDVKRLLEAIEDGFFEGMAFEIRNFDQPYLDPSLATFYAREWRKHGMIADFLQAANVKLRVLCAGTSAVVTYDITMPDVLKNVLILDASFPIRKLEKFDTTIHDAEVFLNLKRQGVDFKTIKKFDHV